MADEQENMIDRYLGKGTMYVLDEEGVKAECVVVEEKQGVLEIKNIAVDPNYHKKDTGRPLLNMLRQNTKESIRFCKLALAIAR